MAEARARSRWQRWFSPVNGEGREQIPVDGIHRQNYNAIKAWVTECYDNYCFCPCENDKLFDASSNVSCYISSPGNQYGGISETSGAR